MISTNRFCWLIFQSLRASNWGQAPRERDDPFRLQVAVAPIDVEGRSCKQNSVSNAPQWERGWLLRFGSVLESEHWLMT